MPLNPQQPSLYTIYLRSEASVEAIFEGLDFAELENELFLVLTDLSQSKLYHLIKRRSDPISLFVGALKASPKFKNMEPGSLKWLRERQAFAFESKESV